MKITLSDLKKLNQDVRAYQSGLLPTPENKLIRNFVFSGDNVMENTMNIFGFKLSISQVYYINDNNSELLKRVYNQEFTTQEEAEITIIFR